MADEHGPWPEQPDSNRDPLGIAEDMDLYSARHAQHGQQQLAAEGEVSTVPRQPIAPDEAPLAERLQQPTSAQPPLPPGAEAMPPPVLQGPVVQGPVVQGPVVQASPMPAGPPMAAASVTPFPAPPQHQPGVPAGTPAQPDGGPLPPAAQHRLVTATDFLDRRADGADVGPATWGWRGRVTRWTGGIIHPRMGPAERANLQSRRVIQRDFDGPRTVVFVNPKGGAAKTTSVLAAGYTFGTIRGGGVIAWDNNETRGTLGIRGTRSTHRNTTRELLEDLERFSDVYQSRIGDLGAFVRSQGDAHFDVLASDERPDVTGMIHAEDFTAVHRLLQRFYRVILVDTGNNMRAENWLAAAETADLLVVTSTVREDTGYSGLWMLDALHDAGYADLKQKTITVLSDPSPTVDEHLLRDLTTVYEQRTRAVFRVPYDPVLVPGSVVPYASLSEPTRNAWLEACAAIAGAL